MAKQKFAADVREAIWLAYGKKCAYTGEILDVNNFHIDHILPEKLAEQPEQFSHLKTSFCLEDNFDLHGFENLLPCKPNINYQKSDVLFDKARIHYFLGIAECNKQKIEKNLQIIQKRHNKGRAIILLQSCFERGELSFRDIAQILE